MLTEESSLNIRSFLYPFSLSHQLALAPMKSHTCLRANRLAPWPIQCCQGYMFLPPLSRWCSIPLPLPLFWKGQARAQLFFPARENLQQDVASILWCRSAQIQHPVVLGFPNRVLQLPPRES